MRAKSDENSIWKPPAISGEGNIPWKGFKRGFVVWYIQETKGAVVEAEKSFKIMRRPKRASTILVTIAINCESILGVIMCL